MLKRYRLKRFKRISDEFINKVEYFGIVDTRRYRYAYRDYEAQPEIRRIRLDLLGTEAAREPWELVATWKGVRYAD